MPKMLVVVKIGGSTLEEGLSPKLLTDLTHLLSENKLVIVHGGGDEVTEVASKLQKEQKFITSPEGFRSRYTDRETVEIYMMVMAGKVNKLIVSGLSAKGVKAIGLSGLDGQLMQAERKRRLVIIDERGRKRIIDGGYTGKITKVNADLLHLLVQNGYVPVVAPVAVGGESEPLNVDGDRAAAYVAGSVKADRLVLLTDVEGVLIDGKTIEKLSVKEAQEILPKIGPGMITKIYAATEALSMGVVEVLITSGLKDAPVSSSLLHKAGTVIHGG